MDTSLEGLRAIGLDHAEMDATKNALRTSIS